jgi:uncharacterized protein (TIGR03086 family)
MMAVSSRARQRPREVRRAIYLSHGYVEGLRSTSAEGLIMIPDEQTARVEVLMRACASTGSILGNVTREQLALPTPCSDWPVHDLINHIVGATRFFADLAEWGSSPEGQEWPSFADGDFASSFGEQANRAIAAFSAPGAMERIMVLPTEPTPGARCIQVATGEIFVHGWDLARATGQAMPADGGVAGALLSSAWLMSLCDEVRNDGTSPFAAELAIPAEAPAADRLVGFLGRDPSWPGGQ